MMINTPSSATLRCTHAGLAINEPAECCFNKCCAEVTTQAPSLPSCLDKATGGECKSVSSVSVLVLMCTYNGQAFLEKQLQSIKQQTVHGWHVAISDDGSQDATLNIANRYRYLWGDDKVSLWQGPRKGFARNFISNVCNKALCADFYAWCDQDDVWEPHKLQAALSWLKSVPQDVPALYFGRTELISRSGKLLGCSPLFCRPPSFANALVQSIGGGNTMVLNHAARVLLGQAGENLDVVSHDWWAYLLVTGVGGNVFYDPTPYVHYRQHGSNLVGSNLGWGARMVRLRMLFQGRFRNWNTVNIAGLETIRHRLTKDNRIILDQFKALRSQHFPDCLFSLRRSGVYRQTLLGNLGLLLATLIKEV